MPEKIGFVFENPDDQLFSLTVYYDIAFSGRQLGVEKKRLDKLVFDALKKLVLKVTRRSIYTI